MALALAGLTTTTAGALGERWWLAQAGYGVVFVVLLQFAVRRFVGRAAGRRPPAAFVLVPMQQLAGKFLQTMAEYPPSQTPGSFNLEKVQKQIEDAARGR